MKHTRQKTIALAAAAASLLLMSAPSRASTFVLGDANAGGIGYYGYLTIGNNDFGAFSTHVGAWSWEDESLGLGNGVGWTHTSRWLAVTLTEAAMFTITMARDANVPWPDPLNDPGRLADVSSMFPSFTLWQGWDNDDGDHHSYTNNGNVSWAEDLAYSDHLNNSTETSISRTWSLPAGNYTFALGSNAPSNNTLRQGFQAAFATPEPGRATLLAASIAGVVLRRRRR